MVSSVSGCDVRAIPITILAQIKRAALVFADAVANEHRGNGSHWHCQQQTHKSEQGTKAEEGKHHPHRVDVDRGADQLWIEDVALNELPEQEHAAHDADHQQVARVLNDGNTHRETKAESETYKRDKAH